MYIMGVEFSAKCNNCGHTFKARSGPGMNFYLLHCDKCGKARSVKHSAILEKLDDPYNEKEIKKIAEEMAARCECGGQFKVNAPPRCNKCYSDNISKIEDIVFYD